MTRQSVLTALAAAAISIPLAIAPALTTPASAQVDVYIGAAPVTPVVPVPVYPVYPVRPGMGDRDRDGVPNRYDAYDNRFARDKDGDGVPNRWDRHDNNPWRR